MSWRDRITADPAVLQGKAVVKGTRIPVDLVLDLLARGWSERDLLANYPGLTADDIRACLAYARDLVAEEQVFPVTA